MRRLFFLASVGTLGLLSCTEAPTGTGRGDLSLEVVAVTVAPRDGFDQAPAAAPGAAGVAAPLAAPSRVGPITVDSARIVLSGPESRTLRATPGTDVTISNLPVGSYTAVLEGWGGDELVYGGTVTSIQVTGGATSNVTQVLFAPTRLEFIAIDEAVQLTTPAGTMWSTGNGSVVTITPTGVLTAAGNGTAAVTGTLGNSTVQIVALVAQQVDSVYVAPPNPSIAPGATQQFTATAYDSLGTVVNGVSVLWVSSNHNVATVDQSGLATGVGYGTVAITATVRGQPASTALSVGAGAPAGLRFAGLPNQIDRLQQFETLRVEIVDAAGHVVTSATDSVALAIADTAMVGAALFGRARAQAVAGVATFDAVAITKAGPGYTLVASSGTLAPDTSAAFDVGGVALFANTAYVQYLPGNTGAEASNLHGAYTWLGLDVHAFSGLDFGGDLFNAWILSIPELEIADPSGAMAVQGRAAIVNFVNQGGTLIIHGGFTYPITFLNTVFGYTIAAAVPVNENSTKTASAAGTIFEGGPAVLPFADGTFFLDETTLPGGSLVMYANATGDAAIAVIPRAAGRIIYLGYDWFIGPPTVPFTASTQEWTAMLARATRY